MGQLDTEMTTRTKLESRVATLQEVSDNQLILDISEYCLGQCWSIG